MRPCHALLLLFQHSPHGDEEIFCDYCRPGASEQVARLNLSIKSAFIQKV